MLDVNILKTFKKRTLRPGYLQSGDSALPKAVGLFSAKDEADTGTRLYLLWIPRVMGIWYFVASPHPFLLLLEMTPQFRGRVFSPSLCIADAVGARLWLLGPCSRSPAAVGEGSHTCHTSCFRHSCFSGLRCAVGQGIK